ncbi:uncharacterized protein LOC124369443 [Homalodisca vitripennis]|uniref:uncharacterized protein LOC124369443 n=1 Tax=Homalodisca vitripennis TaxID=197043 RepID=UPI001EEC489E|nr:uncharacterized protein LOC124369443 [Homalodisca vitripennis]
MGVLTPMTLPHQNPHVFVEGSTQWPEKINVWAGILGNTTVGPVFIEGNLNGESYLNLLENTIDPLIVETLENQRHTISLKWLDAHYLDHWIGRRGSIEWPARSPDLTRLDFFCGVT